MKREDRRKIVTADSVCPALKQGFDQGFFGVGLFRHSFVSLFATIGRIKVSLSDIVCGLFPTVWELLQENLCINRARTLTFMELKELGREPKREWQVGRKTECSVS